MIFVRKVFNIASVDYANVPDCHFSVPLIKTNRAIQFLIDHQEEYHLNMDKIFIMGSSAGAIITSQLGSIISNKEYSDLLGIEACIITEQIYGLVIDDASLDYSHFTLATKMLVENYVKGSIYLSDEEISKFNNILHLTENHPASFLMGSDEYGYDITKMHERLDKLGVENETLCPTDDGINTPHCFVANERTDEVAKNAYDRMIQFMKKQVAK